MGQLIALLSELPADRKVYVKDDSMEYGLREVITDCEIDEKPAVLLTAQRHWRISVTDNPTTGDVIAIGDFLDWLSDHGYVVAGWIAPDGWVPISEEIATKLARKYIEEQNDR